MTLITKYPTKKAFKEAIASNPNNVFVDDPSFFGDGFCGSVTEAISKFGVFTVTNHPKRSWFAEVKQTSGRIVVK